ncbi:MAG: MjaI family restriction endonuclease [Elusimicrobiales bacterium]|nr:MjaI family restriction endonuclease [Elusimicrobiales bacterium]
MAKLKDKSVHLIVTSPPYWQLKDYGSLNQIGFNDSYEDYINNLNLVWKECFRVLNDGCRLCINIGDQFARSVYYGRYKVIPIRTEIIKFCETQGFDYMGAIIWQKATTMNTTGGATIYGQLQEILGVKIEPAPDEWDRLFNVDFFIKLNGKHIGLQIKPAGGVSHIPEIFKERQLQEKTHEKFTEKFGGKVFYVISIKEGDKKKIHNIEVIDEIKEEIERLKKG